MALANFMESWFGRIFLGLLLGFGLAAMLYNSCTGQICEVPVYQGPNPNTIKQSTYQDHESKICYKFTPYPAQCPNNM